MICYDHKHPSDRRSWWEYSTFRVQSKLASREKTGMPIAAKRQGTEAEVKSFWVSLYSRDFFHVPPHVTADDILQIKC